MLTHSARLCSESGARHSSSQRVSKRSDLEDCEEVAGGHCLPGVVGAHAAIYIFPPSSVENLPWHATLHGVTGAASAQLRSLHLTRRCV